MTAKKTATLPAVKKAAEKTPVREFQKPKKDMTSRRSKLTDIADSALDEESVVETVKEESSETPVQKPTTASLPPATKRPVVTKSSSQSTSPAKGGKLELDELLSGLSRKPEPKGPSMDFRQYYK